MATPDDHYQILEVSPKATPQEIKASYRRLAKQFHPDTGVEVDNDDRIVALNHAYEVLGDAQRRKQYDLSRDVSTFRGIRSGPRHQRRSPRPDDIDLEHWLKLVYRPVQRAIADIIDPLEEQIDCLAADPFDDLLMEDFQAYLGESQIQIQRSQTRFKSLPNPANLAHVAQNLYYALNHIEDGIEQLEWFTLNYSEDYLHSGQEMFRRAEQFMVQVRQAIAQLQ